MPTTMLHTLIHGYLIPCFDPWDLGRAQFFSAVGGLAGGAIVTKAWYSLRTTFLPPPHIAVTTPNTVLHSSPSPTPTSTSAASVTATSPITPTSLVTPPSLPSTVPVSSPHLATEFYATLPRLGAWSTIVVGVVVCVAIIGCGTCLLRRCLPSTPRRPHGADVIMADVPQDDAAVEGPAAVAEAVAEAAVAEIDPIVVPRLVDEDDLANAEEPALVDEFAVAAVAHDFLPRLVDQGVQVDPAVIPRFVDEAVQTTQERLVPLLVDVAVQTDTERPLPVLVDEGVQTTPGRPVRAVIDMGIQTEPERPVPQPSPPTPSGSRSLPRRRIPAAATATANSSLVVVRVPSLELVRPVRENHGPLFLTMGRRLAVVNSPELGPVQTGLDAPALSLEAALDVQRTRHTSLRADPSSSSVITLDQGKGKARAVDTPVPTEDSSIGDDSLHFTEEELQAEEPPFAAGESVVHDDSFTLNHVPVNGKAKADSPQGPFNDRTNLQPVPSGSSTPVRERQRHNRRVVQQMVSTGGRSGTEARALFVTRSVTRCLSHGRPHLLSGQGKLFSRPRCALPRRASDADKLRLAGIMMRSRHLLQQSMAVIMG
ncbi:hypothetical protein FB45DRAFT_168321 [Roridomyces roridus]|uniref:Transmembrane protein n=1 Tax=Roridomyces roridus TaxID=1738132 RepID=A0AAD7BEB3_9AGAR|nr:hypothetical protein FB45DRAFT_168321 [Roridomyces roridus]